MTYLPSFMISGKPGLVHMRVLMGLSLAFKSCPMIPPYVDHSAPPQPIRRASLVLKIA
ncbi:hypothetical protein [Halocynthiibacter namhaensis]|uniref:hypothetical protein n=1 Tax=Halocynthiibacter namhaensis TaxID=1290553 RepID=UPI0012E0BDF2|nr:hypothetical protein [Halocynthiibacter namhaensis]